MTNPAFCGLYTAIITPFKNNIIDIDALKKIIDFQIHGGVDGIVVCGTTGESPTLSHEEHKILIKISVEMAAGKIKIIAGTGSNSTAESIEFTRYAKSVGADACLVVAPYYNKPNAEGLYQHFAAIDKCGLPIIIYNIPGRSVIDITDELITELAKLKNIVGVKDATGDISRVAKLIALLPKNKDFSILSGEDLTAIGFNAMGGHGVISVTSNIKPKEIKEMQIKCQQNDFSEATNLQNKLVDLHQALFSQTNPIPVKYACYLAGLCENEIRLPLCEASKEVQDQLKSFLKK
jgi:4-hydroxy-tetrahydrodipicolinate synthase